MGDDDESCSRSLPMGKTAAERGLPECYLNPTSHHASLTPEVANVPTIDFGKLKKGSDEEERATVIQEIRTACRQLGFFQIINHGIPQSVLDGALVVASEFFELPDSEKAKFMSKDVHKAVRYETSFKPWRVFLKHYAHPLENWIDSWPNNPPSYRETMGEYCREVMELSLEVTSAITESLGIGPTYLNKKMENGMQVIAVNGYPPCPRPEMTLGAPPHSDHSCFTIMLQSSAGLEIMDIGDGKWKLIPELETALQVHVGDHFEVLSNGLYKSVVHRATLNSERTRISVASFHSLGIDEKMKTAEELVSEEQPAKYRESSFRDFLNFLSGNDIAEGNTFLDSLKLA
ncbi:PREDICTED: 2'-deoxymugineic-acid 2'-dioxygenase-like [Fragaria vesca subsp. vesca]|uniref:2'-deoxymugineic-acid 2'-dioxygenase-like n=1 Tax=Fragaria vesca subsp. vesca TaxID=101020 RepID=UPI0002C363D3|nr:PREDICTED: 2'-deoxymugineic-acid 2'-dioxygenase-like [Fragaria vesca subsp. vesca]